MKTILAHLEPSPVLESVLASALLVARRFGSLIEGLHVKPGQPDVIAAGADGFVAAAPDLVAGFEREAAERARSRLQHAEARAREAAAQAAEARDRRAQRDARRHMMLAGVRP